MKLTKSIVTFLMLFFCDMLFSQHYGYVNEDNTFVIEPVFLEARNFSEGRAAVRFKDKKGWIRWHFIDEKGNFVTNVKYWSVQDYNEGFATVQYSPDHWGVIDKSERAVVVFFKANLMFSVKDGMVRYYKDSKYGFFNTNRKKVTHAIYDDARDFSNGLAAVKQNGLWGFINKSGEIVIPIQFTTVSDFINNKAKSSKGNEYYELNSIGNQTNISKEEFDKVAIQTVSNDLAPAKNDSKFLKVCLESSGKYSKDAITSSYNYKPQIQISSSEYALDIFNEQGSVVIFKGSVMYVVKVKGKKKQDDNITAAQANQLLGFTTEFKFQRFPNDNCESLNAKYGGNFTVICKGEIDLDK